LLSATIASCISWPMAAGSFALLGAGVVAVANIIDTPIVTILVMPPL